VSYSGVIVIEVDEGDGRRHVLVFGIACGHLEYVAIGELDCAANEMGGRRGFGVSEGFFNGFGGGLACDFARALAAHAVEDGEQPALGHHQQAILIDRATRVESSVAYLSDFQFHTRSQANASMLYNDEAFERVLFYHHIAEMKRLGSEEVKRNAIKVRHK
jgi:hypothetical protein